MAGSKKTAADPADYGVPSKTVAEIASDTNLRYKIRVLIHDLRNVSKNEASQQRTLQTTDELYISSPYFTPKEAAMIKGATCDLEEEEHLPKVTTTVESAIQKAMADFFEKRKASGDARPCGSHDLAPIYETVFGVKKEEAQDEKFISRLRRQGLPPVEDEPQPTVAASLVGDKKKQKKK
ncbi:D-xylulose reductase A [Apiospora arundinis]